MEKWQPPDFREERMRKYRFKAPAGVAADYFRLFANRRAYTSSPTAPTRKAVGITTTGPRTRRPAKGSA